MRTDYFNSRNIKSLMQIAPLCYSKYVKHRVKANTNEIKFGKYPGFTLAL